MLDKDKLALAFFLLFSTLLQLRLNPILFIYEYHKVLKCIYILALIRLVEVFFFFFRESNGHMQQKRNEIRLNKW